MDSFLRIGIAAALLAYGAFAHGAEPGRADFDAGVAAYRAGDAAGALGAFERARAAGYDTPQLRFNLGLCHYRLRRYAEARAQFEALRAYPEFAGVADFHLALVAAREGDRARAESLWRSLERGPDEARAQRAGVALGRLDSAAAQAVATGYLLVAGGYDSNPALLDESVQPASGESAETDVLGAFSWPLSGGARAFTALRGAIYLKDYAEDVGQDQRGAFAGLSREFDRGGHRLSYGLDASTSTLDGERLQDVLTLQAQRTARGGTGWRFGAQASLIRAPHPYAHLEGWRARASVARGGRIGDAHARLGYELEYNDREDRTELGDFYSASPVRHRVDFVVEHAAGPHATLRWNLRYRHSRYRDPDVSPGLGTEVRRVEDLALAGLQLRRRFSHAVFGLLEFQYSDNDATPQAYAYDRHTALLGLEWVPTAR